MKLLCLKEVAKKLGYDYKYFTKAYQDWVRQGTLPEPIRMTPRARPKWDEATLESRLTS